MKLKVTGMSCPNCVRHVKEAIESLPGAENVRVDLELGEAEFEGVEADAAIAAVEEEGYEAAVLS